jgi:hypothetical protein
MNATSRIGIVLGLVTVAWWSGCGQDAQDRTFTLPAGTDLMVRLDQPLTTQMNRVGDKFNATLAEPVTLDGETVIPAGTTLRGSVAQAIRGDQPGGPLLTLAVTRAVGPSGDVVPLEAAPVPIERSAPATAPPTTEASLGNGVGGTAPPAPEEGADGPSGGDAPREIELAAGQEIQVELIHATEVADLWHGSTDGSAGY